MYKYNHENCPRKNEPENMPDEWYNKKHEECCLHCSGIVDCFGEPGTDADFDTYAVQVQNGEGYYDESGNYHSYHIED